MLYVVNARKSQKPNFPYLAKIQDLDLVPSIKCIQDYEAAVLDGHARAVLYLRDLALNKLSVETIRVTHHLMFSGAYNWAGTFRKPGQLAIVAGLIGADSANILPEIRLLLEQWGELLKLKDRGWHPLHAISFFHARFERIHPFRDGNGRVGRMLSTYQSQQLLKRELKLDEGRRTEYIRCLALTKVGDLTPLANFFGELAGIDTNNSIGTEPCLSPFRIHPKMIDKSQGTKSLEEELEDSRVSPGYWKNKKL